MLTIAAVFVAMHSSKTIDIAFVGDIMLGRWVGREILSRGPIYAFEKAAPELRRADLAFGNLECVLGNAPFTLSKPFLLRGDPAQAREIRRAGFAAVTLANNHSLDCGKAGLSQTVRALGAAGVGMLGVTPSPVYCSCRGVRVALIGLCDFPPASGGAGIAYTDERNLPREIEEARRHADVVGVFWHWGVELSEVESERQHHLARLAAAAGADMVIGAHPHVLQPIRWLRGAGGRRCLVAYSLGNFVFDARPGAVSQSEILHVLIRRRHVVGFRVSRYVIRNCRPAPLDAGGQKRDHHR